MADVFQVVFLLAILLAPLSLLVSQSKQLPQRKDSVTVSGGVSKEQLALEDRLNGVLAKADTELKAGQTDDAIKQYESALDMVNKEPLLAEQTEHVLRTAGSGYIQANRPADAVAVFEKLVGTMKTTCNSDTTLVSTCASAQEELGIARMHTGDFKGALASLEQAEAGYATAEKHSDFHEFSMIQAMGQARTKVLISVALFQLGKTSEAITAVDEAIPQLARVKDDDQIQTGIRESAAKSLKDAQTVQARFKAAR